MDHFFSTMSSKRNSLYILWCMIFAVIAVVTCKKSLAESQLKGEENKNNFGFRIELFSKCSKPCGGGTQIGIYVCFNKTSTLAVKPSHCRHLNPPGRYQRVCNMQPCAYRWHTGTWSPCSSSCGEGTKQRRVKCIDRHDVRVSTWKCARLKIPHRKRKCGIANCNPEFEVGPWSKCSSTCGEGRKNRTVLCKQSLANGSVITLPHSSCDGMVPAKAVKCKANECSYDSSGGGHDIQGEEPLDQEADYDASDTSAVGSGEGGGGGGEGEKEGKGRGKDPPIIKVNKQPTYILRKRGSLSVLVGTKVWAVKGSEVTVSCTATGKYNATITWTRDGYEITTYFEDDVGIVNGNLLIRGTDRFNEGKYVCKAKSEGGTARAFFTLEILVSNKPYIFFDESSFSFGPDKEKVEVTVGGKVTLFTGSMLTIKCPVIGKPNPRVWWLSQGRPIAVGKAKMIGNNLVIDKIDKIFSLEYTCRARNFRGIASATTSVNVLDLSPPKIAAQIRVIDKPISSRRYTTVIGTNLTLISGASLMIRCPVSSKPAPFVSWMANGRLITGRVNRIMISRDKSSMIVSKMGLGDSGIYSCMAKNVAGKDTKSSYVKIVAPQGPTIQKKSGFRSSLEKDQEMTVTIGEQATALAGIMLKIVCPAQGLPSPAISWQVNRRAVSRFSRQYVVQENTLVIKKLSRNENGNIACTARNPSGTASASSKVNVIAGLKPQIKFKTGRVVGEGNIEEASITIGQDLRIIEGLIFRLRCPVTGFPKPTVTWSINDNDVVSSQRVLIDKDNNDLIINGIAKSDVGQYMCTAVNPLGQATKSSFISIIDEKSVSIEVGKANLDKTQSIDPVTIRIGDSLTALSGTDVTILCPVKGVPFPYVHWRRNGKEFKPEDFKGQFRKFQMNTVLKILQVSSEVAGEYECIANNVGGFDRVASTITVIASQNPSINFGSARQESLADLSRVQATIGSLVRMLAGSMLSLACPSSGVPRPSFSWDFNGKPIKSQGRFQLIGNSLVINQTMASDTGRYRCTATNVVASDKRHSDVAVLAPIKPQIQGQPKDQQVNAAIPISTEVGSTIKSLEGASLQLSCTAKGLPTPKIQWKFEEIVVSGKILKLPSLDPGDSKNYTCEASNLAGVDRRVTSLFVRVLEKPVILSSEGSITLFKRNQRIVANIGKSVTILKGTVLGLLCHVVGFPLPSVVWTKDTVVLRSIGGFRPFRQNLTHYGMAIDTRFNTDFSGKYECAASNVGGSVAASSVVVVKAPTKPVIKIIGSIGWTRHLNNRDSRIITIGDNAEVLTGTEITINCPVSGLPVPSVTWSAGRRRLTSGGRYTIPRPTVLVIGTKRFPSTVADSLDYRCNSANYLGRDYAVSKLKFTAPKPPKILTFTGQFEYITKQNIAMTIGAKIIAIIDSNITLKCQADGLPMPKITWQRNGVLLRQNGRQFVISKARKVDTGTYQCTASNLGGTRSASSVITVQDPRPKTEKPKIFPSNQSIIASENKLSFDAIVGSNITILEGKNLKLQCPTTGLPTPKVTWYFNNKPIVTSETSIIDPKTGVLTVIEMMKEETGVYTCESKNIAGEDYAFTYAIVVGPKAPKISASNKIYVKLDPTRKVIKINIGDSLTTFKGTRVAIQCLSIGFPDPRIRWNKNDISLAPQIPVFINGSMIILTNPEVSDTGKYTCLAANPGGNAEASSNITFLAPQSPNITTTPGDVEFLRRGLVTIRIGSNLKVLEGNRIAIKCDATGIPTPTLSWRRNRRILRFTGNVLRASNIKRSDSGTITCEARNYFGRASKTSVITVVAGQKPKIKTSTKAISDIDDLSKHSAGVGTSFKVLAGSRIRLSCSATGIPNPTYSWSLKRRAVINSDRIYYNQSIGVLDIKSVIPGDSGQAQCTATNVMGTDRSESLLNIIALRGPYIQSSKSSINTTKSLKPIRIRIGSEVHSLVNTTINIVCQVVGLPVPVILWSYNDEVIRGGRLIIKGATLTIPKAQMDDGGVYACTASSAAGNRTVKSQISLNAGQRPSITSSNDVITEHSDFSTTSSTIGSSVTILTGAGLSLSCPVHGLPPPAVSWKIDGRNAIPGPSVVVDRAKNILTLPKLRLGNAKRTVTVTCTVVNPLGTVSASSDVTVNDPILPRINSSKIAIVQLTNQNPVVSLVGNKISILEGTSVSLVCQATGLPEPEVRWTLANIPVTSDGHVTIDAGVVKFEKVGRGDAGTYSCKASSLVGMATASTVIDVKEVRGPFIDSSSKVLSLISSIKPIEMKIGSNLTALSTTNITIDCITDGFPVPVTSWRKDGKIVIKDHVTVRGSKLLITRARFTDGGVYECSAKSVAGVRKVRSHLTVIAGQKPIISSSDEVESSLTGFTKLTSTIGSSISILAGSGIRILCPVGGIPRPVVTWNIKRKSNKNRLFIDKTQNFVTIPKLVSGDFGEFTCIAKNILGEARALSALNVIEPFKPRIDKSRQRINVLDSQAPVSIRVGATARVLAGVSITIKCIAVGLPYPSISWTLGGKPLKSQGHVTVEDSKLVILNGGSEDSGTYGCLAASAMGNDTAATRLTIHSGEKARITTVGRQVSSLDGFVNITSYAGDNITAMTGSDLTIFCPTEGIPEPLVSWSRAGAPLRSDRRYTVNPITNTLSIRNLKTMDSGGFTCSARNNRGGDQKTSVLNIIVPYGPTITKSSKNIDGLKSLTPIPITIGDNLTALVNATIVIQCKASGLPLPKTSWTRDGVKIVSSKHVTIEKEVIRIQKAKLSDQGVYRCTASSDAGAVSVISVIVLKEPIPPTIKTSNKTIVSLTRKPLGIIVGETVRTLTRIDFNITCEVDGLPKPEIIWRKNGVELPVDGRTYANGPILYVADALTADTGFYVCEAKNVAGKKTVVSKLDIREPSLPEISATGQRKLQQLRPVSIVTEVGSYIKTLETSNITLSCDVKGFPTPTISWKKGVKTLDAARGDKTYTITNATVTDSGIYTCTATNLKGYDFRSSNVTIVAQKVPFIKTTTKSLTIFRRESVEKDVGGSLTTLAGNTIKLICNASGTPTPNLEWYKDNTKINNKASVLIFSPASPRDTGVYSCAARNLAGMFKVDTNVKILEGKIPFIITSKNTISELDRIQYIVTKVGGVVNTLFSSNVEIMCEASGFPKPEVTWYKDGEEMPRNSATHMIDSQTGTLMFVSLALRKAGIYKCVAKNSLGTASASTVLNVNGLKHPFINSSRGVVTSLKSRKPAIIFIGHNLTVLSGTNISITCPSGGVPLPEATWKRGKALLVSGGRVNVSPKVLSIYKVAKSDSGRYICSVENVMGKISIGSNINVLDPVLPNIRYKFSILKVTEHEPIDTTIGTRVTSIPGNRLTLTCNVSGLPTPSITWKRNNLLAQVGGSTYTVPSLKASDSGAYTCVASNLAGEVKEASNIFVIAGSKPEIITPKTNTIATEGENEVPVDVGGNITTIVGTGVEIRCTVTGKPTPSITWLQNGSVVEPTSVKFVNRLTKALTLLGVTEDDSGFYTCFANNTFGQVSETSYLTIFAAERPSIRFSKRGIEDYEKSSFDITIGDSLKTLIGTSITIQCNATGNPPPEIQWFKSGTRIISKFAIKASNNTLKINGAMWSNTGEYECLATNAAGSDKKTSFVKFVPPEKPVIFQDPSVIEVFNRTPVAMAIGNTLKTLTQTPITISCSASGIPMPTYSWTKKGNPVVSSSDLEISLAGKRLTIRNLVLDDAGIYACKAKNKAGTDVANAPILVLEPILPRIESTDENITWYDRIPLSAPIGGKITALTGTQVTLTCNAIGFPEPVVVWRRDDEVNVLETDGQYKLENRSLVIFAVQPGDSGSYRCFAENLAGTVKSSTRLNVIDPQEPVIMTSNKIVRNENRTPVIATIGNRIFVIKGTPVSITCPVQGIPKPSVSWSNGGRFLYPTNNNSTLVFATTTVANSGEYTCTAISPIGGDAASSVLSVAEPIKPRIVAPPTGKAIQLSNKTRVSVTIRDSITVLYGTVLNIECSAIGLPKPKIIWTKENKRIKDGASVNGTLKVRINSKYEAGRFTCVAINSEGDASATSTVMAVEPLYPRIQSRSAFIVALNQPRTTNSTIGTTIKTLSSTTVILQCPATGNPDPIIQWSKSGQLIVSGDRFTLTEKGDLVIQKSSVVDSGKYKCLARNVLGEDTAVSTVIIMNPTRPEITRSTNYIIWYENRPFKSKIGNNLTTMKGRKLTLVCPAKGMPRPEITWYRGGERMRNEDNYVVEGNTLIIWDLSVFDTDRYTCVAENYAGSDAATSTVKVHEPVAPYIFKSRGFINALSGYIPVNVTAGQDVKAPASSLVVLICPIKGVPRPKIIWLKDQEPVLSDNTIEVDCNGTLKFHAIRLADAGEYICYVESFLGMDLALTHVQVVERSIPIIHKSNNVIPIIDNGGVKATIGDNMTALLTQTVVINCNATGIPYPVITWTRLNGLKIESVGMYSIDKKGTLTITGVVRDGVYKCSAKNYQGADSATSYVTVKEPKGAEIISPRKPKTIPFTHNKNVTINIKDNVTTLPNATLTIKCQAVGVPEPSVTWSKDGNAIPLEYKYRVLENGALVVENVVESDSGLYTCKAENSRGVDTAMSLVNISKPTKPVIDRPIEPRNVQPTNDGHVTVSVGENVTVVMGSKVLIDCIADGDPKPSVTWTKDNVVLKADDGYTVHANGTLEIPSASAKDRGKYVCTAKSAGGEDSESTNVMVVEQSKPLIIRPDKPRTVPPQGKSPVNATIGDNVTVLTDSDLIINCPATAIPQPLYSWSKDGKKLSLGAKYSLLSNGTLVIKEVSEEDRGTYTCTVENTAGSDNGTTMVDVVEPEKPKITRPTKPTTKTPRDRSPTTMTIGDNITALDNTSISIDCPASGIPKPKVTWTKDEEELIPGESYVVYDNGTLWIKVASVSDKGRYTCLVRNKNGVDKKTSLVDVVSPKKPKITRPKKPQTVIPKDRSPINMTIGDNVTALTKTPITIDCPASGIPKPKISWRKDGQEVIAESGYVIHENGTLVIEKASAEDRGRYTCVLENLNGKVNSSTNVKVVDEEKPQITKPDKPRSIPPQGKGPVNATIGDNVTVLIDSNLTIDCPATGLPKPTYSWRKDGEKIKLGINFFLLPNGTLIIKKVSQDESGTYKCTVENIAGNTSEITQVLAVAPKKPQISKPRKPQTYPPKERNPVNISVGNNVTSLLNTPIKIVCSATGTPNPRISWMKDGKIIDKSDSRYSLFENGTLLIAQASQEDKGKYTCIAKNKEGEDNASSIIDIASPKKPKITRPKKPQTIIPKDRSPINMTVGDNVTALTNTPISIDCPTSGIPKPKISWRKDGQEVIPGGGYVIHENGTLVIEKASAENRGRYTCVAKNVDGEERKSSTVNVTDSSKPKVPTKDKPRDVRPPDRRPVKIAVGDNITALTNTDVSIDCPATGTPQPTITWLKDGQSVREGGRVVILDNGTLVIKDASREERGRYTCKVKNIDGEDNKTSNVDIVGSKKPKITRPKKPQTIIPEDRSPINMTIGDNVTALTNTPISIDCPASGIPKPKISWRKDGQEVIPGGRYVIHENGTLVIEKASGEDRGRYTCVAKNVDGEERKSSTVNVTDSVKPKIPTKDKPRDVRPPDRRPVKIAVGDNITALTNTDVSIDCPATGTPQPTITWLKDGQSVREGGRVVILDNGTLVIKDASREERGRYTCKVKNIDGEDNKTSTVDIVGSKKPKITRPKKPQTIIPEDRSPINMTIGDNVTALTNTPISIDCPASGIPKPKISWTKDGEEVIPGSGYVIHENGTLVIEKASGEDRGIYTCVAKNVDGEESKSSTVNVTDSSKPKVPTKDKPRDVRPPDRRPVKIAVGDNITALTNTDVSIDCPATGTPQPTITWLKDGQSVREGGRVVILDNGTLVIKDASREERGRYTCKVKNIDGEDNKTSNVDIVGSKKPKITRPKKPQTIIPEDRSPINMTIGDNVTALTNTPISIDCPASGIPKPKVSWRKDGQEVIPGGRYVIHENGTLVIEKASGEDWGRYTCVAKNVDGEESKSSTVNVTDSVKPKIPTKDKPRDVRPPDRRPVKIAVGDNITALTNTDVFIDCPATGTSQPTITWLKDGQSVREGGRVVILDNGTLVIKDASREERGRYTCKVKNIDGEDNKTSTVDIVDPVAARIRRPKNPQNITSEDETPVSVDIGNNVIAIADSKISVNCPVTGTPRPVITWRENGFELVKRKGFTVLDNGTLVIEKAMVNDKEQYTCLATNIAGKDSVTTNVKVLKPTSPTIARPDKPRSVTPGDGSPVNITIGDNVTALTGTPITIDCLATGVPSPQVTWSKDGREVRSGGGYVIHENGTLLIIQASRKERGKYKCTVRNKNGKDSKTSMVDTVDPVKPKITRPEKPRSILPKDRSKIKMAIGDNVTSLTNTPISIDCPASGIPKPKISWTKDGQPITSGDAFVVHENGTLFIRQASKGDEGKYTCMTFNSNGEDSTSSNVAVVDSKKPSIKETDSQNIPVGDGGPKTLKTGDNVTTILDTPIRITCNADGIPKPTITWYKDGKEIGPEDNARVLPNNTLVLLAVTSQQGGVYTCKARNIDGDDSSSSKVTVVSPRKPFIVVPKVSRNFRVRNEPSKKVTISDNVRSPPGKKISITCTARGLPKPKITWSRNGVIIRTGGEYEIDKNNTLTLKDVKLSHSGTYTCTAKNVAGEDRASSKVRVVTFSEPEIRKRVSSQNIQAERIGPVVMTIGDNITTFSGSTITITCNASGIPKPLMTWLKDGSAVIPGQTKIIDQKGSLTLRGVVSQDSGRYTCVAMNFVGKDTEDSFVTVLTPKSPSIPVAQIKQEIDMDASISIDVGADVTALAETTISINCKASGLPEPTMTWSNNGQLVKPGEFYEVLENNTLVIREATEYDSGVFVCTAKNIFGEDEKSSRVTVIEAEIPVIQRTNGDFESSDMKPVVVNVGRHVTSLSRVNINLNCTARGMPPPRIEWMNGGKMHDVKGPLLSLKNVSENDSGKYTCIASNVAGKANASTFVNITEPVSPVIHIASSNFVLNTIKSTSSLIGKSIEMLTGSSLLLICNATGHPTPNIKWTKLGSPIMSRDRYVINGMALRIFGVRPMDSSEITCTATNVVGEALETSELVVKELLRPIIIVVKKEIKSFDKTKPILVPIGSKLITTPNTTVAVRCPVSARPRAVLSWQRNGQPIITNNKYKLNGDKSELMINNVQFSDEGSYVCTAFNRAGTDFARMDLIVAIPPVIRNVRGSFEVTDIRELISITTGAVVTIPKGVSIKIKCDATGVPTPNITWYRVAEGSKNWEPVGKRNKRLYVDKDSFLSIQRSKDVDIARYICVATNVAGRDEGVTYLNVGAVPDIPGYWAAARKFTRPSIKRIETMATVIRGSTLRLRCTVYGSPKPEITWYVVGNENRDRWKIFPDGTLQIQKVDFSDEGNYTCIGKNEYGTTYRSTNVTVLVPPKILDKFFSEAYLKSKAKLMYVKYSSITKLAIKRQQTRSAAVEKGGNLIIGCPVRGRPDPTILWLKNGLKVKNDSKHLVLGGVLMIRNISDTETGEYFCFVRNTAGEDGGGLELHVRDKIIGSWKVSRWSECQYCYGNFLGYANRTVDCMDDRNNTVPESYCSAVPAPGKRQRCRTRSCEAIWTKTSWSQCSGLCGGNGVRKRTVKCVFYKSLLPADGLCNPAEKPVSSEPCNRAPCGQRICKDKVNYCKQIIDRNLCTAYRAWCCETCGGWYRR